MPEPRTGEFSLPAPYDAVGLFRFLEAHAVEGVEAAAAPAEGPLRYARTLDLPGGPGAVELTTRPASGGWRVSVAVEAGSDADVLAARRAVDRILDRDPAADRGDVDAVLGGDPALAALVATTPGIRVPGAPEPGELLLRTIVGQQISVAAARSHLGRLTRLLGRPVASRFAGLTHLFPTPAAILDGVPEPDSGTGAPPPLDPERPLRLPRRSIATVRRSASALATGELGLGLDPEEFTARLLALPGIGPWTVSYVRMRAFGDPDAWLLGDVAVLAGAVRSGILPAGSTGAVGQRDLARRALAWAPFRSSATMHLWNAVTRWSGSSGSVPDPRPARDPRPGLGSAPHSGGFRGRVTL